jgi:hypothetical protein
MTFAHAAVVISHMPDGMIDEVFKDAWPRKPNQARVYRIMEWVSGTLQELASADNAEKPN